AGAQGHRLAVPIALEADAPVVHRDPELRLARRLEELDLDPLRDADRLARLAVQHQERVAVLLDEDAQLSALLDRAMQRIAHLRLARAGADEGAELEDVATDRAQRLARARVGPPAAR